VTLRDDLLPVVDTARTFIDSLGLRTTRVILRRKTWSANEVGLGDRVDTDLELEPRPKVREAGPGRVTVGPITPSYPGGGYTIAQLAPFLGEDEDSIWILVDDDGTERPYRWAGMDDKRAFRIMVTLESLDREDPHP
jgi:hypothetical protein